ncbi:hypothetical protein EKO27_g1855 [Xylaria grammica]|uniref:PH domain-containing protein n=1 Tax=Xylaria grammica TaxID=363999 RepID=A0A439DFR6_9PEZI|nr:hypothetical protein EKO27_g1855 [Xylaria grammica]
MATTPPLSDESSARTPAPAAVIDAPDNDPFRSTGPTHYRFSNFNAKLFALGPNASPAQAKRALEAHLAETDRRMEEAGKLGTALVQQRNELTERLKEVEKLQAEDELSDDLRQKLVGIEKDYNEVARESARAFLPKSRVPSNEAAAGSPFVPEGKRSVSPSKFEAQATASPTKLSVPNRKIRNQPSNRIHDIEFAAEISSSLIVQVRNLQGLLAEKEEELKETRSARSKLEYDAETLQQRLKALDDNEHRYKDENWNLETKIHELMAENKDTADRVKKLTQSLNILQSEKNASQRELDEIKLSHSKLTEEHAATVKHHDIELGTAKRTMVMAESEKAAMQRKIEDLTGQNSDLAKAMSVSMRAKKSERESIVGMSDEDFHTAHDHTTPEDSPPASPIKGTPRHSMLESETLKTSLAHAQRLIQSLRTNVHREKTEKIESRRLLQEARDEIEKLRSEPIVPTTRRSRKADKEFKKPPRLLGSLRSARSEIFLDDPDWEDQPDVLPHPLSSPVSRETTMFNPVPEQTDHFETANETSDAAFETANENATETDDFHTGAEEFSSDDAETETESPSKRRTLTRRPPNLFGIQRHGSIDSTASTEDEDFPYEEVKTPTLPPLHAKFPLRVSRGAYRRSRQTSEEPALPSSPVSFANSSNMGTPQQPAQSLAAELGDFDGSDNESSMSATPSRRSVRGRAMTPPPALPPLPRAIMVDSGMMTEPVHESSASPAGTVVSRFSVGSDYNDSVNHDVGEKLAAFPTPPSSSHRRDFALVPSLALSTVHSHNVEPLPEPDTHGAEMAGLRAEHAEQLKNLVAENASTQAAVIEVLRSEHADALDAAKHDHARELEALRSRHADATTKVVADTQAAHAREIESMTSRHADEISKAVAVAQASHDKELESLGILHVQQLAQKESESKAAHARDLEALKSSHSEELSRRELETTAAHAAELEALKVAHTEELGRREAENKSAHAAEINGLKAAYAQEISRKEAELKAAAAAELEALKLTHAEELSRFKNENEAVHAAELAALVASYTSKIDAAKSDLSEANARQLEDLKSSHADQIDHVKQSMDTSHAEQLESLKSSHLQHIDEIKSSIDATHAEELESLRTAHAQQLADTKNEITAAQTTTIASLTDSHSKQLDEAKNSLLAVHSQELESLRATHSQELESLKATHSRQVDDLSREKEAAHTAAIGALAESHSQHINETKDGMAATHAQELGRLRASHIEQLDELRKEKDSAHAAALAAMVGTYTKQLETQKADGEAAMSREIIALKTMHAQEIETLNNQHAAAHTKELDAFKAALAKQVESSKTEGDAAHYQQIEALNAAHAEIIEVHKRDAEIAQSQALESLRSSHERQIDTLRSEHSSSRVKELELVAAKHLDEVKDLKAENAASRTAELEDLTNKHRDELKVLRDEHEVSKSHLREELGITHSTELVALRQELDATHTRHIDSLGAKYANDLAALKSEHEATLAQQLQELTDSHSQRIADLGRESEQAKSKELAALGASHAQILVTVKADHEADLARKIQEMADSHAHDLKELRQQGDSDQSRELAAMATRYENDLEKVKSELKSASQQELANLDAAHVAALASLRAEHQTTLEQASKNLESEHLEALKAIRSERDASQSEALDKLGAEHSRQLDQLKMERDATLARELDALRAHHAEILDSQTRESDAALARELDTIKAQHAQTLESQAQESTATLARALDTLKAQHAQVLEASGATHTQESEQLKAHHAQILESYIRETAAEKEALLASHAAELEALRASLTIVQPTLGYSSMSSVQTEPNELPELKSPRREAFIIPRDGEPVTPRSLAHGGPNKQSKAIDIPIIAEDDTRQSPSAIVRSETPDSQRPFKEITTNTDARLSRKLTTNTSHQGSQTVLTGENLDQLMTNQHRQSQGAAVVSKGEEVGGALEATPSTIRIRRSSTDSLGSVTRARHRTPEPGSAAASEPFPTRRPGSAASVRSAAQNRPPLPLNHREAIEAARSNSAHGAKGSMGPPLLPASAYRPSSSPQTPSNKPSQSPASVIRATPTPRAGRTPGYADVHSPTRMPMRSRQSSISSFASEIDTRFNIHNGMGIDPSGFGPSTDPRMIQAVTQTMIGEYLWKYTRKTGRGEMSENRHRRFFWVHPYTRALYWSDSDPGTGSREMRAKSVPIEAVRVVADDNPMPPGLHRKSLIVIAPGRTIKFTCTTGQRHETWFNALSYLLLRSGNENKQDAEEVAGNITLEDVDEFNPSAHRRPENGQRPQPPPSLSSYNSRTTRNESPSLEATMSIPTLTPTREKEAARTGTFGRLSGYWRSSSLNRGTFGSLRSRSYQPYDSAIYEASEVPDSAEDLRQIIEQQDRESDRLENENMM